MVSTEKPVSNGEAGASEPFDAFVSYSHADKRYVLRIQRFLESARLPRSRGASRRRLKVFRDDTDIRAARLDAELANALARSRSLVVCCSPRAANADWVRQEIELFLKQGGERPIVPVRDSPGERGRRLRSRQNRKRNSAASSPTVHLS